MVSPYVLYLEPDGDLSSKMCVLRSDDVDAPRSAAELLGIKGYDDPHVQFYIVEEPAVTPLHFAKSCIQFEFITAFDQLQPDKRYSVVLENDWPKMLGCSPASLRGEANLFVKVLWGLPEPFWTMCHIKKSHASSTLDIIRQTMKLDEWPSRSDRVMLQLRSLVIDLNGNWRKNMRPDGIMRRWEDLTHNGRYVLEEADHPADPVTLGTSVNSGSPTGVNRNDLSQMLNQVSPSPTSDQNAERELFDDVQASCGTDESMSFPSIEEDLTTICLPYDILRQLPLPQWGRSIRDGINAREKYPTAVYMAAVAASPPRKEFTNFQVEDNIHDLSGMKESLSYLPAYARQHLTSPDLITLKKFTVFLIWKCEVMGNTLSATNLHKSAHGAYFICMGGCCHFSKWQYGVYFTHRSYTMADDFYSMSVNRLFMQKKFGKDTEKGWIVSATSMLAYYQQWLAHLTDDQLKLWTENV